MHPGELRQSIEAIGPLLPVFVTGDRVVDGAKRLAMCNELGVSIPEKRLVNLEQICSVLWPLHPARALEEAARARGRLELLELAQLCGTRAVNVAMMLETLHPKPPKPRPYRIRNERPAEAVRLQAWIEPQLKQYAELAAERLQINVSEFVRQALWEKSALLVPRAPLHPPRHVKARSRESVEAQMVSRRKAL